jgi:hypothetical protein
MKQIENEVDDTRPQNDAGGIGTPETEERHELFFDVIAIIGLILSFLILFAIIYFIFQ